MWIGLILLINLLLVKGFLLIVLRLYECWITASPLSCSILLLLGRSWSYDLRCGRGTLHGIYLVVIAIDLNVLILIDSDVWAWIVLRGHAKVIDDSLWRIPHSILISRENHLVQDSFVNIGIDHQLNCRYLLIRVIYPWVLRVIILSVILVLLTLRIKHKLRTRSIHRSGLRLLLWVMSLIKEALVVESTAIVLTILQSLAYIWTCRPSSVIWSLPVLWELCQV